MANFRKRWKENNTENKVQMNAVIFRKTKSVGLSSF